MNRRVFLQAVLGVLAGLRVPNAWGQKKVPVATRCREALDVARRHILTHCTNLGSPNAAIHGVRALGRECPLGPGDPFRLVLESVVRETHAGDRVLLEVGVDREGHRNALLKTLLEKGCELDLEFHIGGRPYRFEDYLESARLLCSYDTKRVPIDEHSWTIMALSRTTPPSEARWTNVYGQIIDLERMIDDTSVALEHDTQRIREIDLDLVDLPRDCPVLARACGGLHMLYALAVAYSCGYETPRRREAFAAHIRTHMLRLVYDLKIIDSVEAQNVKLAGERAARGAAFDARLKFLGHTFEIVGVVDRNNLYSFEPDERRRIDRARERLCQVIFESADMDFLRFKRNRFRYDSMTTGICHAYNGLVLSPA